MEFEKIKNPVIQPNDWVTVTDMGHLQEVQYLQRKNTEATIIKMDNDHYFVVNTGEVRQFDHIENRKGSLNSLRQTFKKLRYIINANFKGNGNELHITLTYGDNMTDTKQLYKDVEKFLKKLRYKFKNETDLDYINVVEPQGRGAWHCHLLIRFNKLDKVYIDNSELAKLWGNGFVTIKSLRQVDNIGAYLSAYLSDLDITAENDVVLNLPNETYQYMLNGGKLGEMVDKIAVDENGQAVTKKVIKGGRLHLYPPGMNLYRKSKGIIEPPRTDMLYCTFKKKVGESANPHYLSGIHLIDDENDYQNTIIYEQYNLKRQENQG